MKKRLINDLKVAAFHEAGHLIIVRHFSGNGDIEIKPIYTKNIQFTHGSIGHARVNVYSQNT